MDMLKDCKMKHTIIVLNVNIHMNLYMIVQCTQYPLGYRVVEDYDGDEETVGCYLRYIDDCYSCQVSSYTCERCNDHF